MRRVGLACAALLAATASPFEGGTARTATAASHHAAGVEYHLQRRLDEASTSYARALALDPPREPSPEEIARVRRFAPRLFATPTEFFPLKDAAAIVHPSERLIAYHFFWEDDIDFPEDNDPCDHELVWVRYSADGQRLEQLWTYFHGRILDGGEAAVSDAAAHAMRPRVNVQWGKHGSLPAGWEHLRIVADDGDAERRYLSLGAPISLADYNQATFRKFTSEGRRLRDHPIARRLGWPERFAGGWAEFIDFSRQVDMVRLLEERKMIAVSQWNSAVLNQRFLTYNFRPKTEWPPSSPPALARDGSPDRIVEIRTLDSLQLPPKSSFDPAMPRYPNVWFYVDAALVPSYDRAVRLVADELRSAMRLRELHGPLTNPEGCDFEVRREHLQPWEAVEHRALQHAHAFHMRYYHSALSRSGLERVTLPTASGARTFYRLAASAHYEVEHSNPNHADVEVCPICGRTGEYRDLRGNLVELVHDPLGLELLIKGTIRGGVVKLEEDGETEVAGIARLRERFLVHDFTFPAQGGDRNTLRIGVVVIGPRPRG